MYVACSSLCFSRLPLPLALHSISELRFHKVDLALHEKGPHLKPSEVRADVTRAAAVLRKANVGYTAFHVDIDEPDEAAHRETLKAVCRLGRMLAVPLVNIQAAPKGSDVSAEAHRLTALNKLAQAEGVMLTVETHADALTADPAVAIDLCRRVPGLGLTLDPSHYMVGSTPTDYDALFPHVRHVRLRDTTPERMQVRIGQGQLEYGKIISHLTRERYKRALSIDIRDNPEPEFPVDPEVRKLKFLLESMV